MYNCIGSIVLGYSVVVLIGVSPVGGTGWEERNPFGMVPGDAVVACLRNSNDVRGRV